MGFIRSLFNFPVHKENAQSHAAKVAKLKLARDLHKTLSSCQKNVSSITGEEEIVDLISMVESPILDATSDIYQTSNNKTEIIGDDIDDYLDYLCDNVSDFVGIPTGFSRYDAAIGGGLRRKCVDLIAARPKVGKSMFADAVALNISSQNVPVLVLDTEMSKDDHLNRILASISGVDINKISTGKFSETEIDKEKVRQASEKLKDIIKIYPPVTRKEVLEIQTFLGMVDVRLSVVARDMKHYQQVYKDSILILPHISDIEALMHISTIKMDRRLPI